MQDGPEGVKALVTMRFAAFPDDRHDIEDIFASGDRVAVRNLHHGTHAGPFMGLPASGKHVSQEQMHIVRLEGGRWVEHWASLTTSASDSRWRRPRRRADGGGLLRGVSPEAFAALPGLCFGLGTGQTFVAWLIRTGSRAGGERVRLLLPWEVVFWRGFALPIPPLLAVPRLIALAGGWRSLGWSPLTQRAEPAGEMRQWNAT